MRNNGPVTNTEYVLPDDEVIITHTDPGGRITYANPAFVTSSEFSLEECLGQPQNIVRHPDMPREAFADMWQTIRAGKSWTGIVKNRRKSGGFYWVRANVTPMVDRGRIVGYMSVRVKPTRQEVYYFGTPAGDRRFEDGQMPVWIDFADRLLYGIPGNTQRGFKLADDTSGPAFDPTNGSRDLSAAGVDWARKYLATRFPALAKAPFLGGEVCQYEASPDSHFIVDAHPGASNVWLVGGGSGHGFKMGPAMGEIVAGAVLGASKPDPTFHIARFRRSTGMPEEKWS